MSNTVIPPILVNATGDILIYQGPGLPILFISKDEVETVLHDPPNAVIVLITKVGAAAVAAMLAAKSSFDVPNLTTYGASEDSITLVFHAPNGLTVAYSTDEKIGRKHAMPAHLKVDLTVNDETLDFRSAHVGYIGGVIGRLSRSATQRVKLGSFDAASISNLVKSAFKAGANKNKTK